MEFTMEFEEDSTIATGAVFRVDFITDESLDSAGVGTPVTLNMKGLSASVGTAKFGLIDTTRLSEGVALIKTTTPLSFEAGTTEIFTIVADTAALLDEEAGVEDALVVTVEHNGRKITGSTLTY
jgi:hypothetical protein